MLDASLFELYDSLCQALWQNAFLPSHVAIETTAAGAYYQRLINALRFEIRNFIGKLWDPNGIR